jgi:hypothetical protein
VPFIADEAVVHGREEGGVGGGGREKMHGKIINEVKSVKGVKVKG